MADKKRSKNFVLGSPLYISYFETFNLKLLQITSKYIIFAKFIFDTVHGWVFFYLLKFATSLLSQGDGKIFLPKSLSMHQCHGKVPKVVKGY